jgi:hypothetical protein
MLGYLEDIGFWLAVMVAAVVGVAVFKIVAAKLPFDGLSDLAAFV